MPGPFGGDVAEYYAKFRHSYPEATISAIVSTLGLGMSDLVLDLGCGTGQLTLPLAPHVRAVVAMDPEADMLAVGRREAERTNLGNILWVLGSDEDVRALGRLVGDRGVGAITVGQALHWMDYERLFAIVRPLLRPGGGVAVVANGTPLWLQGSAPSRALRRFMEEWLNTPVSDNACGTDAESRHRYTAGLEALGFAVSEAVTEYSLTLDAQEVAGAMFSAMSPEQLPGPDDRGAFIARLAAALPNDEPFIEVVRVVALVAKL